MVNATALHAQYHSKVWNPDNGNGTYTNPVIYADYSDPDVVAVGDDYYLTASSFNCIPGLPILHSKDLSTGRLSAMPYKSKNLRKFSTNLSMAKGYGHLPSATTMASFTSIGETLTMAFSW